MKPCFLVLLTCVTIQNGVIAKAAHGSGQGSGAGWNCQQRAGNENNVGSVSSPSTQAPTVVKKIRPPKVDGIQCGTRALVGRVVGGKNAAPKTWPWMVGIKSCATCRFFCGGTIVAKRWVITAAHCLPHYRASDLFIDAGVIDQKKPGKHKQSFNCTEIHRHQSYGIRAPYDEDIAVLKLNKDAQFNSHVRPLCLNEITLKPSRTCSVTGFGRTAQSGPKSAILQQADVPIVNYDVCSKAYNRTRPPRPVTKNMICAGFATGGIDACSGDSGGPLTCFDVNLQRYVLGGIVSWGVGCARAHQYGVYTDVQHLTAWITRITGKIQ